MCKLGETAGSISSRLTLPKLHLATYHHNCNLSRSVVTLWQTEPPFHPHAVPYSGRHDFGMSNLTFGMKYTFKALILQLSHTRPLCPCQPKSWRFHVLVPQHSAEVELFVVLYCQLCLLEWWGLCCQHIMKNFKAIIAMACQCSMGHCLGRTVLHSLVDHLPWLRPYFS